MYPVDNGYLKYNMTDIVWHNAGPAQPENNAAPWKHLSTRDDFIIKNCANYFSHHFIINFIVYLWFIVIILVIQLYILLIYQSACIVLIHYQQLAWQFIENNWLKILCNAVHLFKLFTCRRYLLQINQWRTEVERTYI